MTTKEEKNEMRSTEMYGSPRVSSFPYDSLLPRIRTDGRTNDGSRSIMHEAPLALYTMQRVCIHTCACYGARSVYILQRSCCCCWITKRERQRHVTPTLSLCAFFFIILSLLVDRWNVQYSSGSNRSLRCKHAFMPNTNEPSIKRKRYEEQQ